MGHDRPGKPGPAHHADQRYEAPSAFSADGRTVVTAGAPGTVWDITDRTHPAEVGTLDGSLRRGRLQPVRPLLATNDKDGNLALWHMDDRRSREKFSTTPGRVRRRDVQQRRPDARHQRRRRDGAPLGHG